MQKFRTSQIQMWKFRNTKTKCENFHKGCQKFRNPFLPSETHAKCQRSLVWTSNNHEENQMTLKIPI